MSVGSGAGTFNVVAASGVSPVVVTITQGTLGSSLSDYSGVSKFVVNGSATLAAPDALGGGTGTLPRPMEVSLGTLWVTNATALNGPTTLMGGTSLILNTPLSGTGMLTRSGGAISLVINNANALTGTQLTPAFVQAGDSVEIRENNVVGLANLNPAAKFSVVINSSFTTQQGDGMELNGGSLLIAETRWDAGSAGLGDGTLHVGPLGETITARAPSSAPPFLTGALLTVPVVAEGPVQFGMGSQDASQRAPIILSNTGNHFAGVVVNGITVAAANPGALAGGSVTLAGGLWGWRTRQGMVCRRFITIL